MAVVFDAVTPFGGSSGTNNITWAVVCTGSNLTIEVTVLSQSGDIVSGVTYAGVSLTFISKVNVTGSVWLYAYILPGPSTGSNNAVVSFSGTATITGIAVSYTGSDSSQPDSSSSATGNSNTVTSPVTTVADNSGVSFFFATDGTVSGLTGATALANADNGAWSFRCTQANPLIKTPAGTVTAQGDLSGTAHWGAISVSLAVLNPYTPTKMEWAAKFPDVLLDTSVECVASGFIPRAPANPTDPTPT